MKELKVSKDINGITIEKYLRLVLKNAPSSFIYKLLRKKDVKVNGVRVKDSFLIKTDDIISIYITDNQYEDFVIKKKAISSDEISSLIVYEDKNIIIINKPRGLLVQKDTPTSKALDDMVINYLVNKNEYDINNPLESVGPIHRLDRNTAGIVVFSKNITTSRYLNSIILDKDKMKKEYTALVKGVVNKDGFVDASIVKSFNDKVIIDEDGKKAKTIYHINKVFDEYTLLDLTLLSGRMHQIRIHMAYINHPIVGDNKYGDFTLNKEIEKKYKFKNQFLIASKLSFGTLDGHLSYLSNKVFTVPLTKEMNDLLYNLTNKL